LRYFFYFFITIYTFSFSQKKTLEIINIEPSLKSLLLDFNHVFNLKLSSTNTNNLEIKSISEGEYANHFILSKKFIQNTLIISGDIGFTFPNDQDKLSAHKVHAVSIEIVIPKHLQTTVFSNIGNIKIEGDFKSLSTNSKSGNYFISNASGDFVIKTINGNINLSANRARVKATSKSGIIKQEILIEGKSSFLLKTVNGDINIVKSK
jgi:hypothetical protein